MIPCAYSSSSWDRLGLVAGEHLLDRDAGAQLREDHLKLAASSGLGPAVDVAAEHHTVALSLWVNRART